jgi:tRNA(Ile)-lysidine synthase
LKQTFPQQVQEFADNQQLFSGVTKLVVAVSGGADSVALLDWLATAGPPGLTLIVAHLNHGLRADAAEADARFVAERARYYNLQSVQQTVDVKALAISSGASLEEAGREARYHFFLSVCAEQGAEAVAVAHHADDQAETVLLRLIRGAGTGGLRAMRGRSPDGRIIRPFLSLRRAQIEEYLRQKGLAWRDDASNDDQTFLRNRIRHELLPLLTTYNPAIYGLLCTTADILAADHAALDLAVAEHYAAIAQRTDCQVRFSVAALQSLPLALQRRLVRLAIAQIAGSCRSVGFNHLQSIEQLMGAGAPARRLDLPGNIIVERVYADLIVRAVKPLLELPTLTIPGPGIFALGDGRNLAVTVGAGPDMAADLAPGTMFFQPTAAPFPWRVRYFRPGDRFRPSGMDRHQKIKEFFINHKVPREERRRVPILESAGQIIWLSGHRIAHGVGNPFCQGSWVAAALTVNA